jgi:hypothetical protein
MLEKLIILPSMFQSSPTILVLFIRGYKVLIKLLNQYNFLMINSVDNLKNSSERVNLNNALFT